MHKKFVIAIFCGLAVAAYSSAQNPGERQPPSSQNPQTSPAQTAPQTPLDKHIAACMLLSNQKEVALAEFALTRIQDPEVKEFAEKMVADHTAAAKKIQSQVPELANINIEAAGAGTPRGNQSNQPPSSPKATTDGTPDAQTRDAQTRQPTTQQPSAGGDQMMQLEVAAAEQCLKLAKETLSQCPANEFDKAFMSMQVLGHIEMLAKLTASEGFASSRFQGFVNESRQHTEQHLASAKEIQKDLTAAAPTSTDRK